MSFFTREINEIAKGHSLPLNQQKIVIHDQGGGSHQSTPTRGMLTNSTAKSTRMQSQFKSVMEKRHTMAGIDPTKLQIRQDLNLDKFHSSNPQLGNHYQNSLTKHARKQSLPDNLLNIN